MSSSAPIPTKQDVPRDLAAVANTLSEDAQNAALRKCKELNYDTNKGRLTLEETLINLTQARDVLLDAVDKRKLVQLPLKLQYALLEQAERVAKFLASLANGADEILNLEAAVEDITASIWQFNLHNLSGQILGYQNKINQLKAQEVAIRQAAREAEAFGELNTKAKSFLDDIGNITSSARSERDQLTTVMADLKELLSKINENEQRAAGLVVQVQQMESSAAEHLAKSNLSVADTLAIASKAKDLQPEIEGTRDQLSALVKETQELIRTTEANIETLNKKYSALVDESKTQIDQLHGTADTSISRLGAELKDNAEKAFASIQKASVDLELKIGQEAATASGRLVEYESAHQSTLSTQLKTTNERIDKLVLDSQQAIQAAIKEFISEGRAVVAEQNTKLNELTSELGKLESQIRDSIERATGYTLFHSFQSRQEAIAKSKRFWGIALGIAVGVSLIISSVFIWSLRYVQAYNAAFYLKLSISLPLIYAIAFCSVQYSRERRLEEEYAFKSNISISLDPYQKLVGNLVDKTKPEELAKYTAFLIESVNKVFTSPTETIFDDKKQDASSLEKIIKSLGEFAEPLIKAVKK